MFSTNVSIHAQLFPYKALCYIREANIRICSTRVACQHLRCPVWQARESAAVITKDYLSWPVLQTSLPTHRNGHSAGQTSQSAQDICQIFPEEPRFPALVPKGEGRSCHSYHLRKNHQRTVPFNRTKRLDKSPINFILFLINSSLPWLPILYLYGHSPRGTHRKFRLFKSNVLLTTIIKLEILIIMHISFSITRVF